MSNDWLRLWHDMPNDPKWRTIAKVSKQPLTAVISIYIHMLVCASKSDDRGIIDGWCDEDIATALDLDTEQVISVRESMQSRVLDGEHLKGWQKRQPEREDITATERKRNQRAREKEERDREISQDVTQCHELVTDMSRNVTTDTDKTRQDKKEYITTTSTESARKEKIMDTLPPDLNLNDLFVSVGVVCCLFERKPLASKEQETISEWCTNHDMRRVIPLLEAELEKFREKNHKDPASIMYFKPIIAKLPKVNPLAQMTHDLAFRMRV